MKGLTQYRRWIATGTMMTHSASNKTYITCNNCEKPYVITG